MEVAGYFLTENKYCLNGLTVPLLKLKKTFLNRVPYEIIKNVENVFVVFAARKLIMIWDNACKSTCLEKKKCISYPRVIGAEDERKGFVRV